MSYPTFQLPHLSGRIKFALMIFPHRPEPPPFFGVQTCDGRQLPIISPESHIPCPLARRQFLWWPPRKIAECFLVSFDKGIEVCIELFYVFGAFLIRRAAITLPLRCTYRGIFPRALEIRLGHWRSLETHGRRWCVALAGK